MHSRIKTQFKLGERVVHGSVALSSSAEGNKQVVEELEDVEKSSTITTHRIDQGLILWSGNQGKNAWLLYQPRQRQHPCRAVDGGNYLPTL